MRLQSESVILESPGSVKGYTRRVLKLTHWRWPWKLVGIYLFTMLMLWGLIAIIAWTLVTWIILPLPKLLWRKHRMNVRQRKLDRLRHREIMT